MVISKIENDEKSTSQSLSFMRELEKKLFRHFVAAAILDQLPSKQNVQVLQSLYESVEDVELVVAGSLEHNVPGAQAGPTYLCILTEQFYRTRVGDRYFYENGADPDTAFTPSQLKAIRQGSSIARILCDNAEGIQSMQPRAFQQITEGNKPVPCDQLPYVDLTLWQDARGQYKK